MATEKDKGIVGSATDRLRETTGSLKGEGPWHSANSEVYYNNRNCQTGNSIAPENIEQGTGGKPLCGECERLNSSSPTCNSKVNDCKRAAQEGGAFFARS
jgi:hypothetical protein